MNKKNIYKLYNNALIICLFLLSYYLYYLSLEKCLEGEGTCSMRLRWMKLKVIEEIISCFLTVLLLELIFFKKASKLHVIHFIITYCLFYNYSNGIDFDDHGYYNIKYFFIIIIFFLILIFFIHILLSFQRKIILFLIFFLIIFLLSFNKIIYNYSNCNDWSKGLNMSYINNDKQTSECSIQLPKYCLYKIGKYFLDKDRFSSCSKPLRNQKNAILDKSRSIFINKNTMHIGFPLTNKDEKFFNDMTQKTFRQYFYKNFIDMNNLTLINLLNDKKPEVSVDFSKNKNGNLHINLIFNESLSIERKKIEKNVNPLANNILILFLDSVSRASSIRQLKKTLKFFEEFMPYKGEKNKKFPEENYHSFQFFKYHSHRFFTTGNYPILFYGQYRNETKKSLAYYLKKNGFITGYSADECYNDFSRTFHNFSLEEIYDHQYIICDPNYVNSHSKLSCLYDKIHVEYLIEYMNQFLRKYKKNRKFFLMLTNFAHETTLEKLKYIDKIIFKFLNKLFNENLLKDTSVLLLSDHGVSLPTIYYLNDFFKIEKDLPMLYILVNDRKKIPYESQYKNIYENQQKFITGFDIYNTIIHLIFGDRFGKNETKNITSNLGKSLFNKIDIKNRSPRNFKSMNKNICL